MASTENKRGRPAGKHDQRIQLTSSTEQPSVDNRVPGTGKLPACTRSSQGFERRRTVNSASPSGSTPGFEGDPRRPLLSARGQRATRIFQRTPANRRTLRERTLGVRAPGPPSLRGYATRRTHALGAGRRSPRSFQYSPSRVRGSQRRPPAAPGSLRGWPSHAPTAAAVEQRSRRMGQ